MIRPVLYGLLVLFTAMPSVLAQSSQENKTVLVFYDGLKEFPRIEQMDRVIENVLDDATGHHVTILREYFDAAKLNFSGGEQSLRNLYRSRYAKTKPDVVIVFHRIAYDFLMKPGDELFPGIPIISAGMDRWEYKVDIDDKKISANVTGVTLSQAVWPSISLALNLQPKTQHVFLISGISQNDRTFENLVHGELREYEKQIDFVYLSEISREDMMNRVRNLPPQSVILYLDFDLDSTDQEYNPGEVLADICREANAPTYVIDDTMMQGAVGGDLVSPEACAKAAAKIAVRILQGETPANIPFSDCTSRAKTLDAQQLERWKIPLEQAPAGSIILNRSQSIWEMYFWRIIGVFCLIIFQAILIVLLLINQHRRRKAEENLRMSEVHEYAAILEERSRMAREMHDTLAQGFTGVILQLAAAEQHLLPGSSPKALEHFQLASRLARESLGEARRSIRALRPQILEQGNLLMAVDHLLKKMTEATPLHAELRTSGEMRSLPSFTEDNLLRVVQEILTNTIKHSNATFIVVDLSFEQNGLYLAVQDDGKGFDLANTPEGMGLRGIRERVRHLKGEMTIESQLGTGTVIHIAVPDGAHSLHSSTILLGKLVSGLATG